MDEFYKGLKEHLENRPEPPFDPNSWADMERRLDRSEKQRTPLLWSQLMPLASLLLLLLSGIGNVVLSSRVHQLGEKIQRQQSDRFTRLVIRDTIYLDRVVVKVDTVYRTNKVRFVSASNPPSALLPLLPLIPPGAGGVPAVPSKESAKLEKAVAFQSLPGPDRTRLLHTADRTLIDRRYYPTPDTDPSVPLSGYLVPTGIDLGLSFGPSVSVEEQLEAEPGWMSGVQVELTFTENLRLWSSFQYLKTVFDADQIDAALGIPVVAAPSDQYRFLKAQVDQRALQWAAGVKYVFGRDRNWRPYLAAGYGALKILPHEIDYEYRHLTENLETISQRKVSAESFSSGLVLITGGVQCGLSDHWSWKLAATYRARWKRQSVFAPRLFGLQSGLSYRF